MSESRALTVPEERRPRPALSRIPIPGPRRTKFLVLGLCCLVLAALVAWQGPLGPTGSGALLSANAAQDVGDATPQVASAGPASPGNPPAAAAAGPLVRPADLLAVTNGTSDTDARLLRIYGLIATSRATEALEEARRLANDLPNFGLAQLVYADLLSTLASPTDTFGAAGQANRAEGSERMREMIAEARARVAAAARRPPSGAVPAQFVRLDPTVKHAVAVDISQSRLYVFENTPNGLVLKRDYYSSVGKLGMAKQVEGDLRTPLGVYFVTGRIAESRLRAPAVKDLYGAAALALNYPNQYDQLKGRTGSGIWLHGVASALFSRAPLATDGCVALSNPDLLDLANYIERQETPILIADRIEWVAPAVAMERNATFMRAFDAWRDARTRADLEAQAKFYAADARSFAASASAAEPSRRRSAPAIVPAPAGTEVAGISVVAWKDDRDVVVVTFTESSPNAGGRPKLKRQYWLEQAGNWQVVYEGSLG